MERTKGLASLALMLMAIMLSFTLVGCGGGSSSGAASADSASAAASDTASDTGDNADEEDCADDILLK